MTKEITQDELTEAFAALNWRIPMARKTLRDQLAALNAEEAKYTTLLRVAEAQAKARETGGKLP